MININYNIHLLEDIKLEGHLFNKVVSLDKIISNKIYCENGCDVYISLISYSDNKYYFYGSHLYYPKYQIFECNELLINRILL